MWRKMDLNNGQILTLLHQLLYYLVCQVWRDLLIIFHDELPVGKLTCRGGLRQWYVKLSCVNMSLNIKKCADFQLVRQWLQNLSHKSHKYNHSPFSAFFLLFFYFLYERLQLKELTFQSRCVAETDNVLGNQHDHWSCNPNISDMEQWCRVS